MSEPIKAVRPRKAMKPLILLFVALHMSDAQFFSDRSSSSGASVDPPEFISWNLTWQFAVRMAVEPGTLAFPLFRNRTKGAHEFPQECVGLVTVCCLHRLPEYYQNEELHAYVRHLGQCDEEMAAKPSVQVLEDMPSLQSASLFTFNPKRTDVYPRVWSVEDIGVNDAHVVYEVLQENLRAEWLTMQEEETLVTGPAGVDVVDRSLILTFAFLKPTVLPLMQLVLSEQKVLFHDASKHFDENAEQKHDAFLVNCQEQFKPDHALWRADVLLNNESWINQAPVDSGLLDEFEQGRVMEECVWFCRAGYYRFPSSTEWYYQHASSRGYGECIQEPAYTVGVEIAFNVFIRTEDVTVLAASDEEREEVYADIFMNVQTNLTTASLLPFTTPGARAGMIYVPPIHGETALGPKIEGSETVIRAASLAVFTGHWEPSLEEQTESVVKAAQDGMQAWQGGAIDPRVMRIAFVAVRSFIRVPPTDYSVPTWVWSIIGVWAGLVTLGLGATCYLMVQHVRKAGEIHYNQRMRATAAMALSPAFGETPRKMAKMNKAIRNVSVFRTDTALI